jgi:hypothetical protein
MWSMSPSGVEPTVGEAASAARVADAARLRSEIRALDVTAQAGRKTAELLAARRLEREARAAHRARLAGYERRAAVPDPVHRARDEADRAASTIVNYAYRLQHELQMPAPAAEAYRQVVRLFPESRWAEVARVQLKRIEQPEGEIS